MKLNFSATVDKFDPIKYQSAVREAIRQCFTKAAQQFLLAAIPNIRIWTGMARGAFRNVEDVVGKVTKDKTAGYRIRTTRGKGAGRGGGSSNKSKYPTGYFYKPPSGARILRTPQAGRQFATPSGNIFNFVGTQAKSGNMVFRFFFEVNITYADQKQWWNAFKAGEAAFTAYVKANLVLPDPLKFMTRKTLRI